MRLGSWAVVAGGLALLLSACQDPTQIRVEVRTRGLDCAEVTGTRLSSGPLEGSPTQRHDTSACSADRIGDLVYTPSRKADGDFRLQVSVGVNGKTASACEAACGDDCIVARRRMSFVPQQKLFMPVTAEPSCINVCCPEEQTCVDGRCVSAEIDPCLDDGSNCPDSNGAGGGGGGGTGGAGGGGGGPAQGAEVVGIAPLGEPSLSTPRAVVGHRTETGGVTNAFVHASSQPATPYRCTSSAGEVRFVAAAEVGGLLVVAGVGEGRIECGTDAINFTTIADFGTLEGAFIIRLNGELTSDSTFELASWQPNEQFVIGDLGPTDPGHMGMVVYATAGISLNGSVPIPTTGVSLLEFQAANVPPALLNTLPTSVPPTRFAMATPPNGAATAFLAIEMPGGASVTVPNVPISPDPAPFVVTWRGFLFGATNPMGVIDRWTSGAGVRLLTVGHSDNSVGMMIRSTGVISRDNGPEPQGSGDCLTYATLADESADPLDIFSLFVDECDDAVMARSAEGEVRRARTLAQGPVWRSNWMEETFANPTVELSADGLVIQAAHEGSGRLWLSGLAEGPLPSPTTGALCNDVPPFRANGSGPQPFYICLTQ